MSSKKNKKKGSKKKSKKQKLDVAPELSIDDSDDASVESIGARAVHQRFLTPNNLDLVMIPKSENVRVMVRFRPHSERESREERKFYSFNNHLKSKDPGIGYPSDDSISVPTFGRAGVFTDKMYTFDGVLDETTTQMEAFEVAARQTCDDILAGYNGTIFVYGQTGSGKTHTMVCVCFVCLFVCSLIFVGEFACFISLKMKEKTHFYR